MPETLVLIGVEGGDFELASTLRAEVAAAMPALAEAEMRDWQALLRAAPPEATGTA